VPKQHLNVGGTSGGVGEFFTGLGLVLLGGYMLFTNTVVYTNFWMLYGYNLLGPLLLLFVLGLIFLGGNAHSGVGWVLSIGSVGAIVVGIIMNLTFHFKSITLLSALIMFGMPAVGCGLIVRSLRDHGSPGDD
jgi:hypothetical protein